MANIEEGIEILNLSKFYIYNTYYDKKSILNCIKKKDIGLIDFTCNIKAKNICGIVGKERSGKSTVLKIIAGDVSYTAGKLFFDKKLIKQAERAEIVSYIGNSLKKHETLNMNVMDNILSYASRSRVDRSKTVDSVEDLIKEFDLIEYRYRDIHNLTIPMKRRLYIIKGLLSHKEVICFDEPYAFIEEKYWDNFNKRVLELKNKYNKTILISSKEKRVLEKICDQIVWIKQEEDLNCKDK